ncbi:isoprenoid synthase domain-containing protein [Xylaria sp. FL1042]|nr:isoprenoid synthase domain-containing protein [Xylaria sp. FL1042]
MSQSIPSPEKVIVQIPDLFVSFLAEPPRFNPNYHLVKAESEAWISEFCSFDKKMSTAISKCDFSYFMAIAAPNAGLQEFRTLCDWGNWVFPYDDMFDNGSLRDKPAAAAMMMQNLMSPMSESQTWREMHTFRERIPLIKTHDTVWQRLHKARTQRRFSKAMSDYCAGVLIQISDFSAHQLPTTPEGILETRRLSAGFTPVFVLVEYAHELRIPDYVFEHPIIQEIEQLGSDIGTITNDTLSYMKEERENTPHNMIAAARLCGLTAQEAFDYVGNMLNSRYERWEKAVGEVPCWGEEIDRDVKTYIRGISDVVRANLYWSFKSKRYFGKRGAIIRQTRCLSVLKSPEFLRGSSSPRNENRTN